MFLCTSWGAYLQDLPRLRGWMFLHFILEKSCQGQWRITEGVEVTPTRILEAFMPQTQFPWGFAQCTSPSGLLSAIVFYVTALQLCCTDVIILHGAHVQAVLFFTQHQTHLTVESSPDALCFKPWAVSTCITVESRVAVWRLQVIRRKRGFLHCDSLMTRFPLSHNNIHKDDTIVQTQLSDAVWYAVSLAIRYLCYL